MVSNTPGFRRSGEPRHRTICRPKFAWTHTPIIPSSPPSWWPLSRRWGGGSFDEWFYRGPALLIVACPCARDLGAGSVVATIGGSGKGVRIKEVRCSRTGVSIQAVALDKTGTLTKP